MTGHPSDGTCIDPEPICTLCQLSLIDCACPECDGCGGLGQIDPGSAAACPLCDGVGKIKPNDV